MFEIDRIVVIVKPTVRMLGWLRQLSPEFENLSLEDIRNDCTALLIPAFDEPDTAQQYVEEIYSGIFENELELWDDTEEKWPANRSLEMFLSWFDIEFHSMVVDLGDLENIDMDTYSDRLQ